MSHRWIARHGNHVARRGGHLMTRNLRPRQIRPVLIAPVLFALSACSTHPSGTPSADGTVSGTLVMVGGVAPGTAKTPIPGTIELSAHGDHIVTIRVPVNGTFRAQLPVGRYEISATTPKISSGTNVAGSCVPAHPPIAVTTRKTMGIQVTCAVP